MCEIFLFSFLVSFFLSFFLFFLSFFLSFISFFFFLSFFLCYFLSFFCTYLAIKIHTFINTRLRRILRIGWSENISKQNSAQATTSRRCDSPKTLEIDWTHPPTACGLYHTSSPDLEPTGKEKARAPKKHLAPFSGDRNKRGWVTPGDNWRG